MWLIEQLTPQQEALIPVYREKWRKIALSTERIDREKTVAAVQAAYHAIDYEPPEIIFQDSPDAACQWMLKRLSPQFIKSYLQEPNSLGSLFPSHFFQELTQALGQQLGKQVHAQLRNFFDYVADNLLNLNHVICNDLLNRYSLEANENSWWLEIQLNDCFQAESCAHWMTGFDFCISVLKIAYPDKEWQVFRSLVKECGWLFAYDNICIVCDRPLHIRFDDQNRLHAEGEPAIQFIDGYSLYSYHGVTLPENYGQIQPQQWQPQWLLSEENAELR